MRSWFKDHPITFMGFYLVFYLSFFAMLERINTTPRLLIHCGLDDIIPFCKYAIVPYYLWFAWIPFTLFYLLWAVGRDEFWRLCLPLFAGMTLCLVFCLLIPNGVALRPHYVYGTDIFAQAVRSLYRADTSTNVCPSIHVFNAVMLDLAYQRCRRFAGQKHHIVRIGSHLLALSIVLSTMLLKQHSVIDVTAGVLLALALDYVAQLAIAPANRDRQQESMPLPDWL